MTDSVVIEEAYSAILKAKKKHVMWSFKRRN